MKAATLAVLGIVLITFAIFWAGTTESTHPRCHKITDDAYSVYYDAPGLCWP